MGFDAFMLLMLNVVDVITVRELFFICAYNVEFMIDAMVTLLLRRQ